LRLTTYDIDDEQTGVSATEGNLTITDATFVDVDVTLTNDTGAEFAESDIITGVGNGVATDFATWGAGWTR